MTQQESFKRRIRERMAKTGERYLAARRALVEQAKGRRRVWASEPEVGDEAVERATGRGWDDWCDLIAAWPGCGGGHTAIASYLRDQEGVDPWWAQSVTGGYERIMGLRLPHQQPDGTFTAGKSKTVAADAPGLRALLLDEEGRADLFPGLKVVLRSRPASKTLRLAIGPGTAAISLTPKSDGRTRIGIEHTGLPALADVEEWKFYWAEWLEAVAEG